eukprot:gene26361-34998_t
MNSTQSNTTYEGASLMNFIMEVQWYVCLKEQINQQIVLNDVRQNLFGSSDEEAVTLKTSPPLILPLSSICYSMQEMEDSFLSDVVTEPGAYSIPPGNSEDSLLTLSFTSMGSSKDLFCATPPAIRVASPCSATELISPVSQALNRSNGDDEGFLLYALTEPDLEYSLSPPSTISFATSSPEAACDKFNVVDDNTAAIGKLEHLTVSKKLLYTVIEGHSVVVESSCPLATSQYLEQDLPDSGTSAIEYCEIEPMEEVRKGSYSKRAVQFLVLGIGLVAVLLVFLWGINYLRTTMNVDLHSERPFISAPPRSSDNVVSSELHYPLVATISAEATTTVTVTAVPSASVLITTATARVGTAKEGITQDTQALTNNISSAFPSIEIRNDAQHSRHTVTLIQDSAELAAEESLPSYFIPPLNYDFVPSYDEATGTGATSLPFSPLSSSVIDDDYWPSFLPPVSVVEGNYKDDNISCSELAAEPLKNRCYSVVEGHSEVVGDCRPNPVIFAEQIDITDGSCSTSFIHFEPTDVGKHYGFPIHGMIYVVIICIIASLTVLVGVRRGSVIPMWTFESRHAVLVDNCSMVSLADESKTVREVNSMSGEPNRLTSALTINGAAADALLLPKSTPLNSSKIDTNLVPPPSSQRLEGAGLESVNESSLGPNNRNSSAVEASSSPLPIPVDSDADTTESQLGSVQIYSNDSSAIFESSTEAIFHSNVCSFQLESNLVYASTDRSPLPMSIEQAMDEAEPQGHASDSISNSTVIINNANSVGLNSQSSITSYMGEPFLPTVYNEELLTPVTIDSSPFSEWSYRISYIPYTRAEYAGNICMQCTFTEESCTISMDEAHPVLTANDVSVLEPDHFVNVPVTVPVVESDVLVFVTAPAVEPEILVPVPVDDLGTIPVTVPVGEPDSLVNVLVTGPVVELDDSVTVPLGEPELLVNVPVDEPDELVLVTALVVESLVEPDDLDIAPVTVPAVESLVEPDILPVTDSDVELDLLVAVPVVEPVVEPDDLVIVPVTVPVVEPDSLVTVLAVVEPDDLVTAAVVEPDLLVVTQAVVEPDDLATEEVLELDDLVTQAVVESDDLVTTAVVEPDLLVVTQAVVEPDDLVTTAVVEPDDLVTEEVLELDDLVTQAVVEPDDLVTTAVVEPDLLVVTQAVVESDDLVTAAVVESDDLVTEAVVESDDLVTQAVVELDLLVVTQAVVQSDDLVTEAVVESDFSVTEEVLELDDLVTQAVVEPDDLVTTAVVEPDLLVVTQAVVESDDLVTAAVVESDDLVTEAVVESDDLVTQAVVELDLLVVTQAVVQSDDLVTEAVVESDFSVTEEVLELDDLVTQAVVQSDDLVTEAVVESDFLVTTAVVEPDDLVIEAVVESDFLVTEEVLELDDLVTEAVVEPDDLVTTAVVESDFLVTEAVVESDDLVTAVPDDLVIEAVVEPVVEQDDLIRFPLKLHESDSLNLSIDDTPSVLSIDSTCVLKTTASVSTVIDISVDESIIPIEIELSKNESHIHIPYRVDLALYDSDLLSCSWIHIDRHFGYEYGTVPLDSDAVGTAYLPNYQESTDSSSLSLCSFTESGTSYTFDGESIDDVVCPLPTYEQELQLQIDSRNCSNDYDTDTSTAEVPLTHTIVVSELQSNAISFKDSPHHPKIEDIRINSAAMEAVLLNSPVLIDHSKTFRLNNVPMIEQPLIPYSIYIDRLVPGRSSTQGSTLPESPLPDSVQRDEPSGDVVSVESLSIHMPTTEEFPILSISSTIDANFVAAAGIDSDKTSSIQKNLVLEPAALSPIDAYDTSAQLIYKESDLEEEEKVPPISLPSNATYMTILYFLDQCPFNSSEVANQFQLPSLLQSSKTNTLSMDSSPTLNRQTLSENPLTGSSERNRTLLTNTSDFDSFEPGTTQYNNVNIFLKRSHTLKPHINRAVTHGKKALFVRSGDKLTVVRVKLK